MPHHSRKRRRPYLPLPLPVCRPRQGSLAQILSRRGTHVQQPLDERAEAAAATCGAGALGRRVRSPAGQEHQCPDSHQGVRRDSTPTRRRSRHRLAAVTGATWPTWPAWTRATSDGRDRLRLQRAIALVRQRIIGCELTSDTVS